jgi:adenylate cyclase
MLYTRGVDAGLSAEGYRSCCLWCLGYPDQALDMSRETIRHARMFNHSFTLADVLSYAGCLLYALIGDSKALNGTSEELSKLSEEANLSLSGWAGMSGYFLGHALTLQGESRQAIPTIKDSIDLSDSIGVKLYKPMALCFLVLAQIEAGDRKAALETIEQAFAIINETGERLWEVELYRLRARVYQSTDEQKKAHSDLENALAISRSQQAKSWELRLAIDLAILLQAEGKSNIAHAQLSECHDWFTEGFETPDLKQARELLDTLA